MKKIVFINLLLIICLFTTYTFAVVPGSAVGAGGTYDILVPDTTAPTNCTVHLSNTEYYVNSRYISIDLYGEDNSDLYVWLSNDGVTGSTFKYEKNKTVTLAQGTFTIGTDCSTLSTTSNSNNVFRVINWPLPTGDGPHKVYVVFTDSYGNSTSTGGLTKNVTITFATGSGWWSSGTTYTALPTTVLPASIKTMAGAKVKMPSTYQTTNLWYVNNGWSVVDKDGTNTPNYYAGEMASFTSSTTLYASYQKINVGDYITYDYNSSLSATGVVDGGSVALSPSSFYNSSITSSTNNVWIVNAAASNSIKILPTKVSQLHGFTPNATVKGVGTAVTTILNLYKNSYANASALYASNYTGAPSYGSGYICNSSYRYVGDADGVASSKYLYTVYNNTLTRTTENVADRKKMYVLPLITITSPTLVHTIYNVDGATGTFDAPLRFVAN